MAKSSKMRVVKSSRKRGKNDSENSILRLVLMPFMLIFNVLVFFWNLLFRFPDRPSYALGLIRLIIWAIVLWYPDYSALNDYSTNYSRMPEELKNQWILAWPLYAFAVFGMVVYSFFITFGLCSNTTYKGGYSDYTNIDTMTQLIDGRLSSPGNRGKILRKLFDE